MLPQIPRRSAAHCHSWLAQFARDHYGALAQRRPFGLSDASANADAHRGRRWRQQFRQPNGLLLALGAPPEEAQP